MEVFRREGDYWTVAYLGTVSRVPDAKGMRYLARLLAAPGREFHVVDLLAAERPAPAAVSAAEDGLAVGRAGDAGPVLDAEAKRAYRRRAAQLQEELDEAKRFADPERAAKARAELDALTEQLAAAVGLGGRDRRAADAGERARLSVTKALRSALHRLARHDPALGGHLAATVRTGTYCSYGPDPQHRPRWSVGPASPARVASVRPAPVGVLAAGTPLVGRDREQAQLEAMLAAALDGHGRLVVVTGEPGVGKTRLAGEVLAGAARRGVPCAVGRCTEAAEALPYLPVIQVVEALAAGIGDEDLAAALAESPALVRLWPGSRGRVPAAPEPPPAPPAAERQAMLDAVVGFVARIAAARGLVVVLDDLQWADEATLRCVEHLASQLPALPILAVGTTRPDGLDVGHPLARTRERLLRTHAWVSLPLGPLDRVGVAALLEQLTGRPPPPPMVDAFLRQTGGNPFFAEELYRHLDDRGLLPEADAISSAALDDLDAEVPETVQLVIGHRLAHLSDAAGRVVAAAAVVGTAADLAVVARMVDLSDDALVDAAEEAEQARLVTVVPHGQDDRVVFAHDLVRHAVLARLSSPRLRRLHVRAADALEGRDPRQPTPAAELAHHLLAAGTLVKPERVMAALHGAGREALAAAAFDDAHRHLDRAVDRCSDQALRTRVALLADRGRAARALGRSDDAVDDWREALAQAERLGDSGWVAELALELGRTLDPLARWDEAEGLARRALAAVREGEPSRPRLLALAGRSAALRGDFAAAEELLDQALAAAGADDLERGHARHARAVHAFTRMALGAAAEEFLAAAGLLRAAGDVWEAAQAATVAQICRAYGGRLDDADALAPAALQATERVGHRSARALVIRTAAVTALLRSGDLGAFAAYAGQALNEFTALGVRFVADAQVDVGMARFWRGDWDTAALHLRAAADAEPPGAYTGRYQAPLLRLDAYAGRIDAVRQRWTRHSAGRGRRSAASLGDRAMAVAGAEAWTVLGDPAAATCYEVIAAALGDGVVLAMPDQRLLETAAGLAAAAADRWETAEAHFSSAMQQADTLPHRLEQPDTRRLWGQALLRRGGAGDSARARDLLAEALAGYRELDMPRHADLTEAMLGAAD